MYWKLLTVILLLVFSIKGTGQGNKVYTICGKIDGIGDTKVLLGNKPKGGYSSGFKVRYFDSCFSKNDHFSFKGHVNELSFYSIEVPGISKGWLAFILENETIYIIGHKDSIRNAKVVGSEQSDIYNFYKDEVYNPMIRKSRIVLNSIDSLMKLNDTIAIKKLKKEYIQPYNRQVESNMYQFISNNPANFGGLFELFNFSDFIEIDSARKYYSKFSDELKMNTLGRKLQYRLFEYPKLIGLKKPIPDFSIPDTSLHMHSISEFRGKYILIDFWASWCGPCLKELPQVKKLDSLYRSKGLLILGISMDTNRKAWTQSIIKNKIPWINLSDLEGNDSKVTTLLGVKAIPSKFLIDPRGNILLKEASLSDIETLLSDKLAN